jgi:hypothetical protein
MEAGTCTLPLQSARLQRFSATGSDGDSSHAQAGLPTVVPVFPFLDFGGPGLIRKALECMGSQA